MSDQSTTNTGGPAFPCKDIICRNDTGGLYGHEISSDGISIRDYFAAKAMQGLLAANALYCGKSDNRDALACDAYATADAMLRARAK